MFKFALLLSFLYCTSCSDSLLRLPEELSINNYLIIDPDFSQIQEELTVCTWLKKRLDQSRRGLPWFSYATTSDANSLLIKAALHVILRGSRSFRMDFSTVIMRDEWYHFCFAWKAGSSVEYYINGVSVALSGDVPTGRIPLGGKLVLGQEQDSVGGNFDAGDLFAGDIYNLNIFSRALTLGDVTEMYYNGRCAELCRALSYEVALSWGEIVRRGELKGAASLEDAECNTWGAVVDFAEIIMNHLNRRPQ